MNIFKEYGDFLGTASIGAMEDSTLAFWKQAKELRRGLGSKAHLLDQYLSGVFEGLCEQIIQEAADDGFMKGGDLRMLCTDVMQGKNAAEALAHPLYQTVREYIDEHPLPYRNIQTRLSVYYLALADVLLRHTAEEYRQERESACAGSAFDVAGVREIYWELCTLLGDTEPMERLNASIRLRFQATTAMLAFVQGLNNDLLYSLLQPDGESGKQAFQLVLDDEVDIC